MSPYAVRKATVIEIRTAFDAVADRLPGQGSAYERAWQHLRKGRCQYPTSASLVRYHWSGPLDLVLCEVDEVTADEIAEWQRTLAGAPMELHRGDWRQRFRRGFKSDAALFLISFDPYMFDRRGVHSSPNRGNMWPSDIVRAAAAVLDLPAGPVVVQLSTYSAKYGNVQDDVIRTIEPVFNAVGLELASTVWANRNMMSMVFTRGVPQIRDAQLQQRFSRWLRQATAPKQTGAGSVGTRKSRAPLLNPGPLSVMG
jgi:hypothetical protein